MGTERLTGRANGNARTRADDPLAGLPATAEACTLPAIPVLDTGRDFALATLDADIARAHRLLDEPTRYVPGAALRVLDRVSRRWLERWDNAYLREIDEIAARLDRPGVHFFSVMYEWACTCAVRPSPEGDSARLIRVLDWRVPGLGREVVAARVSGPAGLFVTLTWPGFSGVIQAMAPGRFSAALNQAPMRFAAGLYPLDWVVARRRLWDTPHPTAAHVLREAFERSATYAEAKAFLTTAPIALPAIFSLAGCDPGETCVIERTETAARVLEGPAIAANHWQPDPLLVAYATAASPTGNHADRGRADDWRGRSRGIDSLGRARLMPGLDAGLEPDFTWALEPVMNKHTRLLMVADARSGRLVAQGIEHRRPATAPLELVA